MTIFSQNPANNFVNAGNRDKFRMGIFPVEVVLILICFVLSCSALCGQSVTPIYIFSTTTNYDLNSDWPTNSDGAYPVSKLALGPDGNFYGTTEECGLYGGGTIFKVTTNGTFTTLINCSWTNGPAYFTSGLTLGPDGAFYGTSLYGGASDDGTVFKLTTNGVLTTLVDFNGSNGSGPGGYYGGGNLVLGPDGNLYGTTKWSGIYGYGTVFKLTSGGVLTTIYNFQGTDGGWPNDPLAFGPDGNIYGTTREGGNTFEIASSHTAGFGTVFKLTTNGILTTLVNFGHTNGAEPEAGMNLGADGNFYGVTDWGTTSSTYNGATGCGTIFKVTPNGTFSTLYNFNGPDGYIPATAMTWGPDGCLYGVTDWGGPAYYPNGYSQGYGTIFKVTTNGVLTTLATFNMDDLSGNAYPGAFILGPDGNFYGTLSGGTNYSGTIYRLNLTPDFIASPTNQTTVIGNSATFNCQPFGTAPFAYQWLSNCIPITGANNNSLTVNSLTLQNTNAQYQVIVTNAWGSITSSVVTLSVLKPFQTQPAILTGGSSLGVNGNRFNFTVFWAANTAVVVDVSTNLTNWKPVATNALVNGISAFSDATWTNAPKRFYRVRSLQ